MSPGNAMVRARAAIAGPAVGALGRVGPIGIEGPTPSRRLADLTRTRGRDSVRRVVGQLPELLDLLTRSLRSGRSIVQAIGDVGAELGGPLGRELRLVERSLRSGQPVDQALRELTVRLPDPQVRVVAAALVLAAESGGEAGRALDGVARSLRDRMAVASEIRALVSQSSMSALVLAVLPIGFTLLMTAVDPTRIDFLLGDPIGRVCLGAGLALDGAGWIWMRRVIRRFV